MQLRVIQIVAVLAGLWLAAVAAGQDAVKGDGPRVEYVVGLREPQTQMVEMEMTVRGVETPTLELALPVWRPGRYQVLDPAGTIRDVKARSGGGRELVCEKIDKSTWIVQTGAEAGDRTVTVSYRVYANSIGDRTRHVDDTHAFLSPSTVFMYAPAYREEPVRVRVEAPEGWKTATGLERDPGNAAWLVAPDYDVLADCPLEIGLHDRMEFAVDGVSHEIVVWTGGAPLPGYDRAKLTEDFAKIVRSIKAIFGEFPYRRYVFMVHCYPGGGGGTEHLNSTIMGATPQTFATPESTRRFLGLVSHEHFHTWNVKQFRPAGLAPYEYQHENYTDLLWVVEGTTSYYDDLCLVRAGIVKPDDYLMVLAGWVEAYRSRPGSGVQSLAESSFDAWIKFNKPTPDAVNSTVSFYDKGAQVSLLMDLELRARSGNKASMDDVMRELYQKFPRSGPGYTAKDVQRTAERLALGSFDSFFQDYVDGVKTLDFEKALAVAGLEVVHEPAKPEGDDKKDEKKEDGEEDAPTAPAKERAYIGLTLEAKDGLAAVATVLADGPAYRAGVIAGDQVVALNGLRLRATELDAALKKVKPGETVKLSLFRYDVLREIEFKADARFDGKWVVKRTKSPTDAQKAVYESWLGQKWPEKKK